MAEESDEDGTKDRTIRVAALGVVRREGDDGGQASGSDGGDGDDDGDDGDELLVERHRDSEVGEAFYRPLGGGVEFGEHSEDALRREFCEELGVTLWNVSSLGTYEDVFAHDEETHHELWRLYEVDIAEDWPYGEDSFAGYESETDERIDCVWKPISELGPEDGDADTFYPEGLLSDLGQTE